MDNQARLAFVSRLCVSLLFVGQLVGCGSGSSPFKYVPVSGTVSYEDGSPLKKAVRLQFLSLDQSQVGDAHARPALTNVDAEGRFENVTSYKYGDGLVPGRHKVAILDAEEGGKLIVPEDCTNVNTTPLVVDTANLPLEIKVPKP